MRVDANIPAAPPTRAPEPNNISLEMRIAAGLRTCGHAAPTRAGSYYEPLPKPTIRIVRISANGFVSFPFTAAGQFRIRTGFPLRPSTCAGHRNETQDIVFASPRQPRRD
jgi:hypothetical protein